MEIAVAYGDGIGPEIMAEVLATLEHAGVPLTFTPVEMGLSVWERGVRAGITDEAKATVERCGVLLKGPMGTPSGGGVKSINVTARKTWSTFANKRIFQTPRGLPGLRFDHVDITMIRENIEDTYGGIEHMQTHDVAQCRRLITRPGCEQLHRYAFEVAQRKGAHRITCGHKANIMKLTDGLFLETFYQVAREYPDLHADDRIVDALAMELVVKPEAFDVIVLPNLQGDILSDLCAGLVGGLQYAPSANIGEHISIFEAVHGTAPDIAGQDRANPSAALLSACIMLRHLGLVAHARRVEEALQRALIDAHRPPDLGYPVPPISTRGLGAAIRAALDLIPAPTEELSPLQVMRVEREKPKMMVSTAPASKETVGVDLFIDSERSPAEIAALVAHATPSPLRVTMVSNRGTQVWPTGSVYTDQVNHHRVRVESETPVEPSVVFDLARKVSDVVRVCSLETLLRIDGRQAYSLAQGQ